MNNQFVHKLESLVELKAAEVDALVGATAGRRRFAARKDIIKEGDRPDAVCVILRGWAYHYKFMPTGKRQIMAFMLPGDAFDLRAGVWDEMDHSLTALTDVEMAFISGVRMEEMMTEHPGIANAMYRAQLVNEGSLRAWIASMGRGNSIERVSHLMSELGLRSAGNDDDEVVLPLSQAALADALAISSVHANRVLRELRLAGAIEVGRGELTIVDPAKLAKIAGADENYLVRRRAQLNLSTA